MRVLQCESIAKSKRSEVLNGKKMLYVHFRARTRTDFSPPAPVSPMVQCVYAHTALMGNNIGVSSVILKF